ncbi:hypothetical protein BH10PLA2_BH10PLA2_14800 [soil metagenome]
MRFRKRNGLFVLLACVATFLIVQSNQPIPAGMAPASLVIAQSALPYAGVPSCSARSCHGANFPAPEGRLLRNEYTLWVETDPHAQAYAALFNERSARIMKNLSQSGTPRSAHQDVRCLACHVEPHAASSNAMAYLRVDGVGCEACHGPARQWLDPHTSPVMWDAYSPAQRNQMGMVDVKNPAILAKICANCHVGAPADATTRLPLRDVDHDLLSAGHPRLNFEFATYLANLPRHWKEPAASVEQTQGTAARSWAVGQVASAKAALNLLVDRVDRAGSSTDAGTWPEFAEYDCSSCHHGLTTPALRQRVAGTPGSFGRASWGNWYLTGPARLLSASPKEAASFEPLARFLEQPMPPLTRTKVLATEAIKSLQGLESGVLSREPLALRTQVMERLAAANPPTNRLSWELAEQFSLTAGLLRNGRFRSAPATREFSPAAIELFGKLAYPKGTDERESFYWDDKFERQFKAMLGEQPGPK